MFSMIRQIDEIIIEQKPTPEQWDAINKTLSYFYTGVNAEIYREFFKIFNSILEKYPEIKNDEEYD